MSPAFFKHALGRPAAGFTTAHLAAGGQLQAESNQPSCQERKSCQAQHAGIGREKRRAGREATRLPRRAGSFRSAPGMASSRRTTASTEYPEAGGPDGRGESFTSARSFGQASMHSTGSGALSNQARPAGLPRRVRVRHVELAAWRRAARRRLLRGHHRASGRCVTVKSILHVAPGRLELEYADQEQ